MNPSLILTNISRHISLTIEETVYFTSLLKEKKLAAGEILLQEGNVCKYESFVTKGCLKSYYMDENGLEHIIDFLVDEWWADDLFSFLTQTGARTTIKAIEPTQLLQIGKAELEQLYQQIPKFERFFRILFQNAYIAQKEQINQAVAATAEERYLHFMKQKPYAEKRFSQKDIAAYLGVTPQFLSTLRKKLGRVNVD
ncbi:MAG: Crp/Fnr family transcriptional regulator [Bacteroidetes bacterium]|nr:Crp/Fnr family transcriptional regulator [Bacteroidota bacterium]